MNIYVGNLSRDYDEDLRQALRRLVNQINAYQATSFPASQGFGFVEMPSKS
jgi:hypothetical protein